MGKAQEEAKKSNDNRTKVGACLVNNMKQIIGMGFNCMPLGNDDKFTWDTHSSCNKYNIKEETKYLYGRSYFSIENFF